MDDTSRGNLAYALRDLYDEYRTALMNREYYSCRLASVRTQNRILEIIIAVGTSSAVASWTIWQTEEVVWTSIAAVVTLLTIVKPIIDYPKSIERYSKLFVGHGDVYYDLDRVVKRVRRMEDEK